MSLLCARGAIQLTLHHFMPRITAIFVLRRLAALWLLSVLVCLPSPCEASDLELAAEAYDAALAHYNRAEYAAAAELFLEADTIHPSEAALASAMAAARRAHEHLLVVEAAQRAQMRQATAPELAARAREALAEAAKHLSRMELSCNPTPCSLTLDGVSVPAGQHYVLPGSHTVRALTDNGREAAQGILTTTGATYRVDLDVADVSDASAAESSAAAQTPGAGPSPSNNTEQTVKDAAGSSEPEQRLPSAVFYASLGVTGIATALTVWSGLDALDKKQNLASPPSRERRDELVKSVRRTDILLAGTTLLGLATAYIGWRLVDFGDTVVTARVGEGSAELGAAGSF
jgi:hypothetical protein